MHTHTQKRANAVCTESQRGPGVPVVRFVDECSAIIQLHDTTAATDPGDQHTSVLSFEARLTLNPTTNVLKSREEKDGILLINNLMRLSSMNIGQVLALLLHFYEFK